MFLLLSFAPSWAIDFNKPVKEIRIRGNQRANSNTIRFYIHSRVGKPYSIKETREDIKRIFNLGYFDDIKLEVDEKEDFLILTFRVEEKPFVKSVLFEGLKDVPEKDMRLLLSVKKGTYFQKHLLKMDIKKIKQKYRKRGFYFTEVQPVIKDTGNHQVDVTYRVKEHQKIKITEINFRGNRFLKEYELLEVIETETVGFWSFMTDSGNYEREILKTDRLRLESKYRDFGFIKARIEEPRIEIDEENGMILINFIIHEGDQYHVGKITAVEDKVFKRDQILEKITLNEGDPFNQSLFRENLFKVAEMYSDKGYAYATPLPKIEEHPETKTVDISVKVDSGDRIYIGRINIMGNEKTHENVIRREFRIHEGELFSGSKLRRTRQRINNTGFFERVEIDQKSGREPDLMDLDIRVTERPTGSIQAGIGYNSTEYLSYQLSISENNFFGTGRRLSLTAESSDLREDYYISFTEPKYKDRDIFLNFQLYSQQADYFTYVSYTKGGSVTGGRAVGEFSYTRLQYKLQNVKVRVTDPADIGTFLQAQEGTRLTSSIKPIYGIDTRDNRMFPREGSLMQTSAEIAGGLLGGQLNFYKLELDAKKIYSLPMDFVLHTRGEIKYAGGYQGQELPLFENYFLGGTYDMRGFSFEDVGPLDENGDAIGGNSSLLFNVEIHYPFSQAVTGLVFYDRGQVYGDIGDLSKTTSNLYDIQKMRHGVGFGLRLLTPVGPINMSWGFKLDRKEGESPMQFHLLIGGIGF